MVHRPDLSLKRLTPTNHDELLFDDVLWVERAQWEHDQFVARCASAASRSSSSWICSAEALAASEEARQQADRDRRLGVYGRLVAGGRSACSAGEMKPEVLAKHLVGGLTVAESGHRPRAGCGPRRSRPRSTTRACSSSRRSRTRCSRATRRAGSTAASRSTRCTGRPAGRGLQHGRDLPLHPMFADADFEFWYPQLGDDGDSTARLRPRLARGRRRAADRERHGADRHERALPGPDDRAGRQALFAKGGAERVIAVVMTKDRAHMHLDTVFTLLDRDVGHRLPEVVDKIRAISLRPGSRRAISMSPRRRTSSRRWPTRSKSRS